MAIGDMPSRKNVKWGAMTAGDSNLSDEWHGMEPSTVHSSEKWVDQKPSSPLMSEKWVDIEAGSAPDDEWHEMKQDRRVDPYSMFPSEGNKPTPFKSMKKEKADGGKVERKTQHTEFGSTREI